MNADLEQLVALQTADTGIRRLQKEIDATPERRAEIESEFDQRASEFRAVEERRDAARAARAQLETQLAEQRTRAEKAERDLMSSTNSKSYEAAIRESDAAKKHIADLETKILEQMEQLEQAEKGLAEHEPEVARLRGERDEKLVAFEQQSRGWAEEIERMRAERERIFAGLSPSARTLYQRISTRIRDGVAVAEARNASCSACFISLRPQVMAEIRRGQEIIQCDNCNRILFYRHPAAAPAQATGATTPAVAS
ncbi:MAG TPA: C4-type zinc ribbon domain-containing protein [Pyrinomonadaceae bacterium]|nr:C4-type zinc ribbon domain-containing protein [Pyrinomonadaceae bacterium]